MNIDIVLLKFSFHTAFWQVILFDNSFCKLCTVSGIHRIGSSFEMNLKNLKPKKLFWVSSFHCNHFVERSGCSDTRDLGGPWTWWVSSAPQVLSGHRVIVIAWWAACGGWLFFIDPSFLVNSYLNHSRVCSLTAVLLHRWFPSNFYNYARVHCETARTFFRTMHSVHLISVGQ